MEPDDVTGKGEDARTTALAAESLCSFSFSIRVRKRRSPIRHILTHNNPIDVDTLAQEQHHTDGFLINRAQNGDPDAFSRLFDRHYPHLYRFTVNMGATDDDAKDVVQTAFIRTHRSLNRIRDGQALLRYLYRAAVNGVRDLNRRHSRKPWLSFNDLRSTQTAHQELGDSIEAQDTERALIRCIQGLPESFREVFILHHLNDLGLDQISDIVGVPVGTVKSRLGRAREQLRGCLKPFMNGDERL